MPNSRVLQWVSQIFLILSDVKILIEVDLIHYSSLFHEKLLNEGLASKGFREKREFKINKNIYWINWRKHEIFPIFHRKLS